MIALNVAVCRFPIMRCMQAGVLFEKESLHPIKWDALAIVLELRVISLVGTLMRRAMVLRLCSDGRQDLGDIAVDQLAEGSRDC